jgi:PHD/YefM family antitoxin component YafN of YafNO toxin-antitoxin module
VSLNPIRPPQQFLMDQNGIKTHVILPLEEYEEMIDQLLDARDSAELPKLVAEARENSERITIEELRAQYGLEP